MHATLFTIIKFNLLKGLDTNKDHSYFLHALNQEQLAHSLFPIGHLSKQTVRDIAAKAGFKIIIKKTAPAFVLLVNVNLKLF